MSAQTAAKSRGLDLCTGPFWKKIWLFTLPIIATGLLQLLFNAADLVVVGRYAGEEALGAVGATGALINLIVNMFMGLSVGSGVMVAQGIGAKDEGMIHRTVHTSIPAALCGGVILTVVGVSLSHVFLEWMDTPAEFIDLSALYMQIYFAGMIPNLLYNFGASILRAAGDTKSPLIYLSLAGVVNVLLNLVFVIVFHMSVAGVALATISSQLLACILVLRKLTHREDACRLEWRKMKIYPFDLWKIARIGLPAGIQGSLFSISNVMIQSSINGFGPVAVAGNTAAGNIEGFVYVAMNSFHQTAMNFMGQNTGARKYENYSKILWICLISVGAVGLVLGGGCYLFAESLLSVYITDSPQAILFGVTRMSYVCVIYFICGLMDVMSGMLRGMGSSLVPMAVTVLGVCGLRLGWIYTIFRMEQFHTLESLYISYPISWVLTFVALLVGFLVLKKRMIKKAGLVPQSA